MAERRTPKLALDADAVTSRDGVVSVPVRCPERIRTGAAATVSLVARVGGRNRVLASETVDLGSGERRVVKIRLSPRQRATVRALGSRRVRAHVQVVDHRGVTGRQAHQLSL